MTLEEIRLCTDEKRLRRHWLQESEMRCLALHDGDFRDAEERLNRMHAIQEQLNLLR